jgi:hypothetical protein
LENIHHINFENIDNWRRTLPSYYSGGNPPPYQSVDRLYIHSSLENSFNLEIILLVFIFLCFLILWRMRNHRWFNYFMERMIQFINISMVIRIVLIIFIINLLIFNNSFYSISIMIPFSFFNIDFRDSFEWKFKFYKDKPKISYLKLQTLTKDIENLLLSLIDDVNYSMSLSFISSYKEWEENKEEINPLFINDAIIVNKESDPVLITQFIMQSLNNKSLFITNWLFDDNKINKIDPIILTVTVAINVEI